MIGVHRRDPDQVAAYADAVLAGARQTTSSVVTRKLRGLPTRWHLPLGNRRRGRNVLVGHRVTGSADPDDWHVAYNDRDRWHDEHPGPMTRVIRDLLVSTGEDNIFGWDVSGQPVVSPATGETGTFPIRAEVHPGGVVWSLRAR